MKELTEEREGFKKLKKTEKLLKKGSIREAEVRYDFFPFYPIKSKLV